MTFLEGFISLVQKAVTLGGGIWLLIGIIIFAGGLKDKNGPQIQTGIWNVIGGGVILIAAVWFQTLDTDLTVTPTTTSMIMNSLGSVIALVTTNLSGLFM